MQMKGLGYLHAAGRVVAHGQAGQRDNAESHRKSQLAVHCLHDEEGEGVDSQQQAAAWVQIHPCQEGVCQRTTQPGPDETLGQPPSRSFLHPSSSFFLGKQVKRFECMYQR